MSMESNINGSDVLARLERFFIETPSWGYADTGTRFGKFPQDAAATTIEEKLMDAAEVHRLTGCCPTVAVHVLWDFPEGVDPASIAALARRLGLSIGSINPNVFQADMYRFGSLTHRDARVREAALAHILDSIRIAQQVGSNLLALWFADGTNYPGQGDFRRRKRWMAEGLRRVHDAMPADMTMLVEYKPFEPAFYHTDIADWGMACVFARQAGHRARVLVDTGHHLHGCNIEHVVAFLIDEEMLGGFHFNDRRYADDDLMIASIDPYQVFRIFLEIVSAERELGRDLPLAYMVDQSHNIEPKVQAMIRTVTAAQELFLKALIVDQEALRLARTKDDVIAAEGVLRDAFSTDVRPMLAEFRKAKGLPEDPLRAFRESGYEQRVAAERGLRKQRSTTSYA